MSKRPGIMLKLPDGRVVIRYNKQPLLQEHNRVVLNLLNDDLSLKKDNDQAEVKILKSVAAYNEMLSKCELVGYVD